MFHGRPVHSLMLSSHRFLCLPLRLPPWTVPCRIVLASPDDRVTCPYHFSLRLFTVVKSPSTFHAKKYVIISMEIFFKVITVNQKKTQPVFVLSWVYFMQQQGQLWICIHLYLLSQYLQTEIFDLKEIHSGKCLGGGYEENSTWPPWHQIYSWCYCECCCRFIVDINAHVTVDSWWILALKLQSFYFVIFWLQCLHTHCRPVTCLNASRISWYYRWCFIVSCFIFLVSVATFSLSLGDLFECFKDKLILSLM